MENKPIDDLELQPLEQGGFAKEMEQKASEMPLEKTRLLPYKEMALSILERAKAKLEDAKQSGGNAPINLEHDELKALREEDEKKTA